MLPMQTLVPVVERALETFWADLLAALPKVIAGAVFLAIAGVLVLVVMRGVRVVLRHVFHQESPVYRDFVATIVAVFLWFGVALSFLAIVGMPQIAASIGSAAGFVALGVSYALSDMIADAVAGVYLLRDPDFMPGDEIDIGGTAGVVQSIELRKTRLAVDEGTTVRGNAEIEKKWTKLSGEAAEAATPEAATPEADTDETDNVSD